MPDVLYNTSVSLTTSASTSPTLRVGQYAEGVIIIPTGSSITDLTFYASHDDSTYVPLYDASKTAVAQTTLTAGRAYEIPSAAMSCHYLRVVANAAGTVHLTLKEAS